MWRWDQQEPFGVNAADENPSGLGVFDLPLRLPGQYFDKETGLHYSYFRDCYDASTGRFCQADPIGRVLFGTMAIEKLRPVGVTELNLQGLLFSVQPRLNDLYSYANGDPIGSSDPLGLISKPQPPSGGQNSGSSGTQVCQFMELCQYFAERPLGAEKICIYQCTRGFKEYRVPALLACPDRQAFF